MNGPTKCGALFLSLFCLTCSTGPIVSTADLDHWATAESSGPLVQEGYERCARFVQGWLNHADPKSGLIPRNLEADKDIWNAKDAAADNYPFMVLTAALLDSAMLHGRMLDMLRNEEKLTSRVGHMPDTYRFSTGNFDSYELDMDDVIFGSSEYIKDGLLPLTEWLGESPWSDRMIDILDDIWANASMETKYGLIPSDNVEVNGEMLQVLSRIYWMTGSQKYLDWALRLGDYYLLDDHHPTRGASAIRLRDHGCEIVSGLCELYATVHFADKSKKAVYQPHVYLMLDQILASGRNSDGMFYDVVNPQTGEILNDRVADNFGYNLNGFYTVYQLDGVEKYRDATIKALDVLASKYRNFAWEGTSSDGYADAIEGALNLYNRDPLASTQSWMDSEIKVMWAKQQEDGVIEGWHGDGNFARTTIMYNLWKTKGAYAKPWNSNLQLGSEMEGDTLWTSLRCEEAWKGKLYLDIARHAEVLALPYDWPRINQFPEWFVADPEVDYELYHKETGGSMTVSGKKLASGYPLDLEAGTHHFKIYKKS